MADSHWGLKKQKQQSSVKQLFFNLKKKKRERERERAWELFIFWNALFQHTFFFSLNKFLRAVLGLQRNWEGRTEISHVLLASAHAWSPQESASLTNISRLFFFLARMNLLGHDIITQSPYFTSEFTLDVVHSMDLDKCIKTYVYHYNVI